MSEVTESATLQNLIIIRADLANGAPSYDSLERLKYVEKYIQQLSDGGVALIAENEALKAQVRSITEKIYTSEDFADALALSKPGRLLPLDDEGRLSPQGITVLVHSLCALQAELKRYVDWAPSDPGTKEAVEKIEARLSAATPGPWVWRINLKSRFAELCGYGQTIMDSVRWGMGSAAFRFRKPDGLMYRADELTKTIPGREHHKSWCQTLEGADINLIANAPADLAYLLTALRAAMVRLEEAEKEAQGLRERLAQNHDWYCPCGHWNGANLDQCAACARHPGEQR